MNVHYFHVWQWYYDYIFLKKVYLRATWNTYDQSNIGHMCQNNWRVKRYMERVWPWADNSKNFFNWRITALQCCSGFCYTTWISSTCTHSPSFLDLPPSPIPHLQVIPEHQAEFPGLYGSFPIPIYFTHGSIYISMLLSIYPPFSSPTVSTSMFSMSVSVFTPCKRVHHYHLSI